MTCRPRRSSGAGGGASVAAVMLVFSFVAAPMPAAANQIYPTICDGVGTTTTSFVPSDTICVAGDVDYTCPSGPITIPAADIYVVPAGADPFAATPVHFDTLGGFGGFWDQVVLSPPLPCGTFDILMDEHCDGALTGDDVRVTSAFTVSGAGCPDAGVPDAGASDAGASDAGASDAGASDAGASDAGTPDAGAPDAGVPDAGPMDAGADVDGGPGDAAVANDAGEAISDGGCGCRVEGHHERPTPWLLAALFAGVFVRRRRRS